MSTHRSTGYAHAHKLLLSHQASGSIQSHQSINLATGPRAKVDLWNLSPMPTCTRLEVRFPLATLPPARRQKLLPLPLFAVTQSLPLDDTFLIRATRAYRTLPSGLKRAHPDRPAHSTTQHVVAGGLRSAPT